MTIEALAAASCPTPDDLKALAVAETGLEDFGDPARDNGLAALLESMRQDSWDGMTRRAREVAVDYLSHQLVTRLKLMATARRIRRFPLRKLRRRSSSSARRVRARR